jgi:hypothetical protein
MAEIGKTIQWMFSSSTEAKPAVDLASAQRRTLSMMGWLTGFFAAIWCLGFINAAPVMTFLYLKINAQEKWWLSLLLALLSWIFFYSLFNWAIQLPFPPGAIFDWLHRWSVYAARP